VAAVAVWLGFRFFSALPDVARRQRAEPCLALEATVENRPAPPFELSDQAGRKHRLSDYRGRVVLLNFWATWCPPCVEEAPALEALAHAVSGPDIATIAVSVDEGWEDVKEFVEAQGFGTKTPKLTLLLDVPRKVAGSYGTTKFPETYVVDRDGQLLYRFVNKRDWSSEAAQACLRSLL